jgi:hypothetical protein
MLLLNLDIIFKIYKLLIINNKLYYFFMVLNVKY